jgi:CBS domain-containing protein
MRTVRKLVKNETCLENTCVRSVLTKCILLNSHIRNLVTKGNISGVISERDYINKIALLGKVSKETLVKEISTKSSNLMTASPHDSVDECMEKMLVKDIRHLPLLDDDGKVIGMLSVSFFFIPQSQ